MTKTSKILFGLLIIEMSLTAYFFYSQPKCEPYLPNFPCEPCINETQIITFWTGVLIAIFTIGYLLFINFRQTKNGVQHMVWRYWGLTNIASAFVHYCTSVRAGRYKFGL